MGGKPIGYKGPAETIAMTDEFDRYFHIELYKLSERTLSEEEKDKAESDMRYIMSGERDEDKVKD